ncbi:MAG: hypothetical protein LBP26_02595 [Clostridiales bacterium]|jgi:uncharacterized membrane protein|nr:hypothetical protein [Clostridiales bacterium]
MKELIKKKGFWAALAGVIALVCQIFGVKASLPYVNEILSAVAAFFVAVGLLTASDKKRIDDELHDNDDDNVNDAKNDDNDDDGNDGGKNNDVNDDVNDAKNDGGK